MPNMEFPDLFQQVTRAMKLTAELNALVTDDVAEVRAAFSRLIGRKVDESFLLIPPFYTNCGLRLHIGKHVFINYACSFMDVDDITLEDHVMVGPRVNLIAGGHPVDPVQRRAGVITHAPIVIKRYAWIGSAATVLAGVTVGENAVVAAGAVVTADVDPDCVVAGNPAKVVKRLERP
jgi:acetyltransferase-like isoleucine patch superfamily enzyme